MRKKLPIFAVLAFALVLCALAAVSVPAPTAYAASEETVFDESDVKTTVGIMSDVHVGYDDQATEFRETLRVMKSRVDIDVWLSSGDVTQMGTASEAATFRDILASEIDLNEIAAVLAFGNHDTAFPYSITQAEWANVLGDRFYKFDTSSTDKAAGNRHAVKNGMHFLAVECDNYGSPHTYKQSTVQWLDNELAAITSASPNAPVFVASHPTITDTTIGSVSGVDRWVSISSRSLTDTLSKYPQVIFFSGHSHYPIFTDRAIMQTDFTAIHVSSLQDTVIENGFIEGRAGEILSENRADIMIAEVDGSGNVRITRLDCLKNEVIDEPWIIPAPKADRSHLTAYGASRANKAAPEFDDNAQVSVNYLGDTMAEITIDAAHDSHYVDYYTVRIYKGEQTFPVKMFKTVTPRWRYSDWQNLPAQTAVVSLEGIEPPYRVQAYACDSWGNESEPIETVVTQKSVTGKGVNALELPGIKNKLSGRGTMERTAGGYKTDASVASDYFISNAYTSSGVFYDEDADEYLDSSEVGFVYEFDMTVNGYSSNTPWFGAGFYFCSVGSDAYYVRIMQNGTAYLMCNNSSTFAVGSTPNRELARRVIMSGGNTVHGFVRITSDARITMYLDDGDEKVILNGADFYELSGASRSKSISFAPGFYSVGCTATFSNLSLRFTQNISEPSVEAESEELISYGSIAQGLSLPQTVYLLSEYSYSEVKSAEHALEFKFAVSAPTEVVFRKTAVSESKLVFGSDEVTVYNGGATLGKAAISYPVKVRLISSDENCALYVGQETVRFQGSSAPHYLRVSSESAISEPSLRFLENISLTRPVAETYPVKPAVPPANTEYIEPPLPYAGGGENGGCGANMESTSIFAAFAVLAAAALILKKRKENAK